MLAGNLVSLLFSFFITVPISLIAPDNFSWESTKNIAFVADEAVEAAKVEYDREVEEKPEELEKALKIAYGWAWGLTFFMIFLFPLPMLGERYIFTWQFFTAWVIVSFAWAWVAAICVIVWPIAESLGGIQKIFTGISVGHQVEMVEQKDVKPNPTADATEIGQSDAVVAEAAPAGELSAPAGELAAN